jgi:hypothetical protein
MQQLSPQNIVKVEDTFGNVQIIPGKKPMEILIDIILYLLSIVLSMALGNIFKKTDDSMLKEIVKSGTKNRNRSHHPVDNMFRDLRH